MRFSDSYLLWAGVAFLANFGAASAEGSNYGSFHTKPRDYDARDYYALQLDGRDPEAVARHFGLQHEGVIGELKGHHLFSTEKDEPHVDVVKRGIEHFQARRRKREPIPEEETAVFESIKLHQKQHTKRLHKRYPPPPKKDWQAKQAKKRQDLNSIAAGVGRPTDSSMIKLQKLQKALDIEDPIFKDQWHLVSLMILLARWWY
jgi:kexin